MSQNAKNLTCEEFEDRIHQLLDDRLTLTGDDALMQHAASCEPCNELLHDYDSVEDSIKLFRDDINAAIEKRLSEQTTQKNSPYGILVALAAGLLLIVGMYQHDPTDSPSSAFNRPMAGSASLAMATPVVSTPSQSDFEQRITPITSPFHPEFSLVRQIPSVPDMDSLSKISNSVHQSYTISEQLPGVHKVRYSWTFTFDLIRKCFTPKSDKPTNEPDLGLRRDLSWSLTA